MRFDGSQTAEVPPLMPASVALSGLISQTLSSRLAMGDCSDSTVIIEGYVFKESSEGQWKRRFLSLREASSGDPELFLTLKKPTPADTSTSQQAIRKQLSDFADVFQIPTRYMACQQPFGFAWMASNGRKLTFGAENEKGLRAWLWHLSRELNKIALQGTNHASP